ncbi:MAG: flippase-like domain-containing protein [Terrimonas sp.]|nr:flippase-like domain-containing protein [Terrimonas sp.]
MAETETRKEGKIKKAGKLLLKIGITVLCFWYISHKVDFLSAKNAFLKSNWWLLALAVLLLIISKIFSAFRLNIYFSNINLHLPSLQNIRLYWLGMFYNLFLPGAISGDAYKVILLNKKFNAPYKKTSAAVLLDRFSGLLALGLILSVYAVIVLNNPLYDTLLVTGALLAVLALYLIIKFFFKDFLKGFWPTFFWGLAVQLTQVVCVYCILKALDIPLGQSEWIFIFLAAAVISVLPLSLGGGLGTREFVFVEGANYFHLSPETGVVISLLFYLISVLASSWGLYFVFHDPLKPDRT